MRRPLLAALIFAAACSSSPKPELATPLLPEPESELPPRRIPPPSPEELALAQRAVAEAEQHWGAQAERVWSEWMGLEAPEIETPPATLLRAETILALERVASHAEDPATRERYGRVHGFLAGLYLDHAVGEFDEKSEEFQLRFLSLGRAIVSEAQPSARARLGAALLEATEELVPLRRDRVQALSRALSDLEHGSSFAARASQVGGEAEELIRLAASLLQATDTLWREALADAALKELGLPASEIGWVDLPRILGGAGLQIPLRARSPEQSLEQTLVRLGIDLAEVPKLEVEVAAREGKKAQSLCLPVLGGVRLAIPPGGGPSHQALFRDVGCALAAAASGPLPPEHVLRGFGGLFARLTSDSDWLSQVGGLPQAEARARSAAFALRRLYFVRRHAARVLAEAESDQEAYEAIYERHMGRALGIAVPGALSRLESSDLLWSIEGLRGALLASSLRESLGPRWWEGPEGKEKLFHLLAASAEGVDSLLAAMGREAIEVEPFVAELRAALAWPEAVASAIP